MVPSLELESRLLGLRVPCFSQLSYEGIFCWLILNFCQFKLTKGGHRTPNLFVNGEVHLPIELRASLINSRWNGGQYQNRTDIFGLLNQCSTVELTDRGRGNRSRTECLLPMKQARKPFLPSAIW